MGDHIKPARQVGCASVREFVLVRALGFVVVSALSFVLSACGSGGSGMSSPPTAPSTNGSGTTTVTVTIANNAVSPKSVTVSRGGRVTFVNNDGLAHDMESDPHPAHTDCPEINQVGFLSPGQSHQTGVLASVRVCGYHDHEQPDAKSLQGTITIQ